MSMRSLVPTAVVVLMLVGCAPVAQEGPSDAPAAASSSAPTVVPQSVPKPILPLACDALLSDSEAQSLTGAPVTLKEDEDYVANLRTIALRQSGVLSCTWGGEGRTDNSYNQTVIVTVLPNAADAFDENVWQIDDGATVYPEGSTTSEYRCQPLYTSVAYCTANVLLGDYWVQAWVQAQDQTDESIAAGMRILVDTLTTRITAAGEPRPAWTVPPDALVGESCGQVVDVGTPPALAPWVGFARSGARECTSAEGAHVTFLPGGGWGVALAEGHRDFYGVSEYSPIEMPGADRTLWGCGDGCSALVSIGGSALSIYASYDLATTLDEFTPLVASIVAEVTAGG